MLRSAKEEVWKLAREDVEGRRGKVVGAAREEVWKVARKYVEGGEGRGGEVGERRIVEGGEGKEWMVERSGCGGGEARVWRAAAREEVLWAVRAEMWKAARERRGWWRGQGMESGEGRGVKAGEGRSGWWRDWRGQGVEGGEGRGVGNGEGEERKSAREDV